MSAQADFEAYFDKHRALYEEAIRKNVCSRCIDFGEDRICHKQGGPEQCQVIRNLKELAVIAHAVHAKNVSPYVGELRRKVCSQCHHSKPDGSCPERVEVECCLDRYLPMVLDVIEEVDSWLAGR